MPAQDRATLHAEGLRKDEVTEEVLTQAGLAPAGTGRVLLIACGALAREIGVSAQAMGQLCGGNPLPILVPCHRVLGAQGLGGFSAPGGVETKVQLLRHEGAGGFLL